MAKVTCDLVSGFHDVLGKLNIFVDANNDDDNNSSVHCSNNWYDMIQITG